MKPEGRRLTIVVDRKAALMLIAFVVLIGGAGLLSSQQLTMTATYPIPAGVYNQIVTTGDSGTVPADTTLNRNAGNTILVPATNASGSVGVGIASPASYAKLDVNTSGNRAIHTMDGANGGLLIGYQGPTLQARNTSDGNAANLILQGWGGNVGIGTASPASALSVNGGVQPGDDASACTAGKAGTQRWHAGSLQVCDGVNWSATVVPPQRWGGTYSIYTFGGHWCGWPDGMVNVYTGGCTCPAGYRGFVTGQAYRWNPWDETIITCMK